MLKLSERKQKLLYAVVQDYILTAQPVGSAQVSEKKGIRLSPATVRSVMSELEERGFLKRAHASSGRIPTPDGYRFYVDQLMRLRPLNKKDKDEISHQLRTGTFELNEILKETCRVVADRVHHASVGVTPKSGDRSFKYIQFLRLKGRRILAILVCSNGIVENRLIELDHAPTQSELDRMHNYLNQRLAGLTIRQVRQQILLEMKRVQNQYDELLNNALLLGEEVFGDDRLQVHIEGQRHLLTEPEFAEVEKMQKLLETLEERTKIVQLLDRCLTTPGVKIFVGDEIQCPEIDGLTLITSPYSDSDGNKGLLGVIGPTRLNYARIVPLVEYTSELVTDVLRQGEDE